MGGAGAGVGGVGLYGLVGFLATALAKKTQHWNVPRLA